ncbi:MAG: MerR family transcriptional regulator, partial [Chitinophagales bacterium]
MPYKEREIEKIYWSIGEVSEMLDITFAQIRLWEKEFDIFNLKKNKKGDRYFKKADIENLKLVKYLLKEKKYTIKGVKEKLK